MNSTAATDDQIVVRQQATSEQQRALAQMSLYPSRAEEITRVWRLTGPLDAERLALAVGDTVTAHDMLRARLVVEAEHGAFLEIFDGYDGMARHTVSGGVAGIDSAIALVGREPLTSRQRWFEAVLVGLGADSHALIFRMHHSLVDGYSMMLVEKEIWDRYGNDTRDVADPVQYGTLVRAGLDPAEAERARRWWADRLDGARATSALPSPHATGARFEARDLSFDLTPAETERLRELARANRTSLTSVLLTAHMMTVSTFGNDSDVTTAIAYLNRDQPGVESVVGPLVNLVPIRASVANPGLAGNLDTVTTALRQSLIRGRLPYDQIIASTGHAQDGGFGIARTAFSMTPGTSASEFHLDGGLRVERVPAPATETRVDFAFTCAEDEAGLRGALVYRADMYTPEIAAAIRDHFCSTIRFLPAPRAGVAAAPRDRPIDRGGVAGLLSLARFGANDPVACDQQHGAVRRPDFEALVHAYSAAIPRDVVAPRVALALGSSVDQAAAMVATWRRGGCAVPVDPRHSAARRAAVLAAQPVDVVIDRQRLPSDDSAPEGFREPAGGDIAYVVHTSGTDGIPKGVAVTYANLAHLLSMLAAVNAPVAGQNPLGPAFDGWIWATLFPWVSGKPVVYPARGAADVTALVDGEESSVTLTPTMLADCDPDRCPATIISAGEPLTGALAARFAGRARILNAYGPTEVTVCASWSDTARGEDPTTIGRPAPDVTVHVLDLHGRPVPVGAVGEMYVGGPGVALGYVGTPGRTAGRFVADPFGPAGGRLYRTGDLATVDSAGLLRFAGRNDGQAKVSGVRIELDETAAVLRACESVREAAAVVVTSDAGTAEVWAAVTADPGVESIQDRSTDPSFTRMYDRLLPEARPTRTFAVPALPRTSNGKLDRARLAETLKAAAAALTASTSSLASTRQRVAAVWERVLSVRVDDYDETFFEYGGHSLAAARAIRLLHREFDRAVPAFALYDHPTVNELSAWLDANR